MSRCGSSGIDCLPQGPCNNLIDDSEDWDFDMVAGLQQDFYDETECNFFVGTNFVGATGSYNCFDEGRPNLHWGRRG